MAPHKTAREVNDILQNLRGEHFRHAQNAQGKPASPSSLSFHAHNRPTLPVDLIYPPSAARATGGPSWVPGPSPPRSWRSHATSTTTQATRHDEEDTLFESPAWRERALSLLFSDPDVASSPPCSPPETASPMRPNPGPQIPRLTLLCIQLIRAVCSGACLAGVVRHLPPHLRRALVRYSAVHAPLSQLELDALRHGAAHVDAELVVVGPGNTLHGSSFRVDRARTSLDAHHADRDDPGPWDAAQTKDGEALALGSLAVLAVPLSVSTVLAFPPSITHLALIRIPNRIPLQRLPSTCPLLVLLDVSYNVWLRSPEVVDSEGSALEEVEWGKLRRLKVVGLRRCTVTPKLLLQLNKGRWEDVKVVR